MQYSPLFSFCGLWEFPDFALEIVELKANAIVFACNSWSSINLLTASSGDKKLNQDAQPHFCKSWFLTPNCGITTILPIGIGLYFDEIQYVISLFLACVAFLGYGYLLNALCKRKDLDFKSSNVLFLAAFIVLPLTGSLPYLYSGILWKNDLVTVML
jgi:hypothetical protein